MKTIDKVLGLILFINTLYSDCFLIHTMLYKEDIFDIL